MTENDKQKGASGMEKNVDTTEEEERAVNINKAVAIHVAKKVVSTHKAKKNASNVMETIKK